MIEYELNLEEIKYSAFQILKFFKIYCKDNNINYFLSNGTLLGAVKYKGYIPWDDDIDIFVPRKDYDRLMTEFMDTNQYKLFSIERTSDYWFPFAKLCDMTTRKEETGINNGVVLGLEIDIFPLDYFKDDIEQAKTQISQINRVMSLLNLAKLDYAPGRNLLRTLCKNILIFCLRCSGAKRIVRKIIKIADCGEISFRSQYMGCVVWPIYGEREIISAEVFDDIVEVEFEGELFPAPIGYDTYLRSLYGDYKKDPHLEKQKTHHSFKAYRIEDN